MLGQNPGGRRVEVVEYWSWVRSAAGTKTPYEVVAY